MGGVKVLLIELLALFTLLSIWGHGSSFQVWNRSVRSHENEKCELCLTALITFMRYT